MILLRTAAVILVVWGLGAFRDPRTRSLVYILPIPMTVVLVASGGRTYPQQVLGVLLVAVFFFVAQAVQRRTGRTTVTLAAGLVTYLAAAALLRHLPSPGLPTALVATLAGLALLITAQRSTEGTSPALPQSLREWRRFVVIAVTAVAATALGGLLGSLVVTFPYSGIPLVVDARHHLRPIARNVTRNCLALTAFFTAAITVQDHLPFPVTLLAAWTAFAITAAGVAAATRIAHAAALHEGPVGP